jgi:cell division protein ZapA
MPYVTVTLASRNYRLVCGEGEEAYVIGLAQNFDAKIAQIRQAFGDVGEMRLHVMAALTIADELAENRKKFAALERENAFLRHALESQSNPYDAPLLTALESAAETIENLTKSLEEA